MSLISNEKKENKDFLCDQRPKIYKVYKCGLAAFSVSMLIHGYVYQQQNQIRADPYWYTGTRLKVY